MAVTNYSPLLGLALPTTGDLTGTWGDIVNEQITDLLDDAIAGTTTLTADANVTLSTTQGGNNQARQAIINCTGARTALRTITAPAQSKAYVIINATSGGFGVRLVGAGPSPGVTIAAGERALVAWNGSDFVVISTSAADGVTSVSGTGTVNGITLSGTVTSTGNLTLGGSLSNVSLATQVTGTLPIANGGTGQTTKAPAFNALSPITTTGDLIYGSGTNTSARLAGNTTTDKQFLTQTGTGSASAAPTWGAIADADVPASMSYKTISYLSLENTTSGYEFNGSTFNFQNVTAGNTIFSVFPNTSGYSALMARQSSDPTNYSYGMLRANGSAVDIVTGGAGSYTQTTFRVIVEGTTFLTFEAAPIGRVWARRAVSETFGNAPSNIIDAAGGNFFELSLSGAATVGLSGSTGAGVVSFIVVTNNTSLSSITWWSTIQWPNGTPPTVTANGKDIYGFFSLDNTNWYGFQLGKGVA